MQVARARLDPRARGGERVVVVDGRLVEVALAQPHRLARRGCRSPGRGSRGDPRAHAARSCAAAPARRREDFSGWNCAPNTLPRSTTETKRSPYSARPTTSASSAGPAGERVHVVEGRRARRSPSISARLALERDEVPADVRELRRLQRPHLAGQQAQAAAPSCSSERSNSSCMPRQMPEQRHAGRGALGAAARRARARAGGASPPGTRRRRAGRRRRPRAAARRVARDPRPRADVLERLLDAAAVAHAVVGDRDHGRAHASASPSSTARRSRAGRSRGARAARGRTP